MSKEFDVRECGNKRIIWMDSNRIDQCMRHYFENNIDIIGISPHIGYLSKDLLFLDYFDVESIKGISIASGDKINISGIEKLRNLIYISVSDNKQPLDYTMFKLLEVLRLTWHQNVRIGQECKNLKSMHLWSFKSPEKDLGVISELTSLEELGLVQSNIEVLNGVENLTNLKWLELSYCPKLTSIKPIEVLSDNLEVLRFGNCKKIGDKERVVTMKNLRKLAYNDCDTIDSIHFIKEMRSLKDFRFVNTKVLDGDMTPCFELNAVGFLNKRGYSHTKEQVDAEIAKRKKTKSRAAE